MKYTLKTTYPCLVKTQNDFCQLEKNDNLEIEDEHIVFVYPQANQLPFQIDFSCENEFYSIINHENQTFVILEPPKKVNISKKEKMTISGKTCNICVNESSLEFETETHKFSIPHKNQPFKTQKIKSFACVIFDNEIFALNMQNNKLFSFSGEEISLKDDEITLTKKFCDSLSRQKQAKYKLGDDVTVENESFSHNLRKNIEGLLPFQLLESVKAKDYAYALDCLADNLKNNIDTATLQSFFGNLKEFLPLTKNQFITISDHKKNFVTFSVSSGKIDDISIDEL